MHLREYLDLRGVSAITFADKVGVTAPTVYRWLAGQARPQPKAMRRVVEETRGAVTANDFYADAEPSA